MKEPYKSPLQKRIDAIKEQRGYVEKKKPEYTTKEIVIGLATITIMILGIVKLIEIIL